MANEYIQIFTDCLDAWSALTDEEVGQLVRALLHYKRTGGEPELSGGARYLFPAERVKLDRAAENYQKRCQTNSANGAAGGRPKNPIGFSESETNRKNPIGFLKSEKSQEEEKEEEKEKDEEENTPHTPLRGAFDRFWQAYPKKVGKQTAWKAFQRVKVPVESLLTAIERQKCSSQWSRDNGQYIPNPATWLNQGRWEDEVPEYAPRGQPAHAGSWSALAEQLDRAEGQT